MAALDPRGRPLAVAISLTSGSVAQLRVLVVDQEYCSRSVVRYALNAFAVRVAIESGAQTMLLHTHAPSERYGLRLLANNIGYRDRRIILERPAVAG